MNINVTSKHISNGMHREASHCPVAISLKEKFKTNNIEVYTFGIYIDSIYHPIPRRVKFFIFEFDNKRKVKPFNFKLNT